MNPTIYVRLSKRARSKAEARLGLTLPWTCVLPSVERYATGGVALVTEAQYGLIQDLPGVTRLQRDPWRQRPRQEVLL
jgi:hypothetical protein